MPWSRHTSRTSGLDAFDTERVGLAWKTLLVATRLLRVLQVDASTRNKAFALWEKYPKVTLSLTDATSAVLARGLSIKTVFGFDADFRAMGFTLLS